MYSKKAFSIEEQIDLLKSRGLNISNTKEAAHILENISYYRLAGYWWTMQVDKTNHIFKKDSTFENVIALYNFDRELRIMLFGAIEKIEISLRTKLIHELSLELDPWWFSKSENFLNKDEHNKTLKNIKDEINRSKEKFITEHEEKYKDDNRLPPAWKSLEVVSLGVLSRLYGNLKDSIKSKDKIAADFGTFNHSYLKSWLFSISQIRNHCAHHSRLWNRTLKTSPKLFSKTKMPWINNLPTDNKLYKYICCIKYLLNIIQPENKFTICFIELLEKYPNVDPKAMGIPINWKEEDLWKDKMK